MADPIGEVMAQAAQPEPRFAGRLVLASGRAVVVDFPLGITAEEMIELMVKLPGAVAQANMQARGPQIALPNGQVRLVPPRS